MTKALVWLAFTYCVLKLASMARARNPDFRRTDMRLQDRLRAREPALFLVACLISVPLALLTSWYAHRTLAGLYAHSTDCYGQIMALKDLSAFRDRVDGFVLSERVREYQGMALKTAEALGIQPTAVSSALEGKTQFFAVRYATLQSRGMRQMSLKQINMARRCLLPPGA